jgi:hypothetical protein
VTFCVVTPCSYVIWYTYRLTDAWNISSRTNTVSLYVLPWSQAHLPVPTNETLTTESFHLVVSFQRSSWQGPLYPWGRCDISTGAGCNRGSRFQDKYSMKDLPSTPSSHKMVSIRVLYIGVLHQDAISTFLLPRDIQPYGCAEPVSLGTSQAKHSSWGNLFHNRIYLLHARLLRRILLCRQECDSRTKFWFLN